MTEPTPRTDNPETGYRSHYAEHEHNRELCRSLERQCARQSALLRDVVSEMKVLTSYLPYDLPNLGMTITVKEYAKLVERIERELKG